MAIVFYIRRSDKEIEQAIFRIFCAQAGITDEHSQDILIGDLPTCFLCSLSVVLSPTIGLTNMMMQTIRRLLEANFVAAARSGLFFIPLVLWLPRCWGLTGLEMCQAVSDVLSFVVCFFIARRAFRMMRRMENEKETVQNTEGMF